MLGKTFGRLRGGPSREGSRLFGRPIPLGDEGAGKCELGLASLLLRVGEVGCGTADGPGETDLGAYAGDTGRASREVGAVAGLPARGKPPKREDIPGAGEAERVPAAARRDTWLIGPSPFSGELGPATRRKRSSN